VELKDIVREQTDIPAIAREAHELAGDADEVISRGQR
jgi:hypothetical protein